ncbi:sugar phosphate isomerase/epimerase family protein [Prauserella cavernicola]|uniref:Sugar phosphate isomerase/epimerase n=1 Tax=Prauserella cavernicola TaxID=2800127 RepID=A0A934QVF1_9PSEU|nr:sugar phosphate isomerase/epimerase [Prauserella cavernicola]MBK1787175.1 sugar phosphate isomerase/epimerase [Prauserella cavernicola]
MTARPGAEQVSEQVSGHELIAACWTTAGACDAMGPDDRSPVPIRERVAAAVAAGFAGFGIGYLDLMEVERTVGFAAFRALLDEYGVRYLELEVLDQFHSTGETRARSDAKRADLLRAAESLGALRMKSIGSVAGGEVDIERAADDFGRLCEQAKAASGMSVGLESMPFTDIRTPDVALEIVSRAGQANGGIFLDIWHVARAGLDVSEVASLPVEHIAGVEIDDADAEVRGTLIEDTFNERRFPGEGVLDVQGFVDAVAKTGYSGPWGVEMLSTDFRAMPVRDATRRAYDTTIRFLDR